MDSGKPIKESRDVDVPLAAAHFWYYAGWADKLDYAFPGRVAKPLGVAAQIIPWNFPLLMLAWKIAPALAAGNTVVLKPASTTPLSAMLFAEVVARPICRRVSSTSSPGPGEIGMHLATHPDVDKVAFTGSTEIGKKIGRGVAGTDKALTLELGGKAANIVFDDAPLDQAVEGIVNGIYFNQGEVCCAGSRLLVQESIAETLVDKLIGVDSPSIDAVCRACGTKMRYAASILNAAQEQSISVCKANCSGVEHTVDRIGPMLPAQNRIVIVSRESGLRREILAVGFESYLNFLMEL